MKHITKRKNKTGFTLIEILVAIAIVAVLSAAVITSLAAYRSKARSAKALASLSSAIPSIISCWGNSGTVNSPSSGGKICKIDGSDVAGYGQWPATSGDLSSYSYGSSVSSKSSWYASLTSSDDNKRICCNSTMNSCKILDTAVTGCGADTE